MSAPASLQTLIGRYVVERRRLGFEATDALYLSSLARHLRAVKHKGPLTLEVMADWARRDSHGSQNPKTWARRLKRLRTFTRWLQQFEPRTEVPDDLVFGSVGERLAPHIYTEAEIGDLLGAAGKLRPKLRGAVHRTLFGLMASTGLRISEAIGLTIADVDLKSGMLTIRQSKFGKSRQVPVHSTTLEALRRYRRQRDLYTGANPESPFFIGTRGRRLGQGLSDRQVHRVFAEIRRQLRWRNRGAHHAPRIHDLRHSFVVHRILRWQDEGVDIDQAMLQLSIYVGHTMVTNTYWYLSAVPELVAKAAKKFKPLFGTEVAHA